MLIGAGLWACAAAAGAQVISLGDDGRVRMLRGDGETRLDKPSRSVRVGDGLVLAVGGRLIAVKVEALGERRGPAAEARTLY